MFFLLLFSLKQIQRRSPSDFGWVPSAEFSRAVATGSEGSTAKHK